MSGGEHEQVATETALHRVRARVRPGHGNVVSVAKFQAVIALSAHEHVATTVTDENVVAVAAHEFVIAGAAR